MIAWLLAAFLAGNNFAYPQANPVGGGPGVPDISLSGTEEYGGWWNFTGSVTDDDDDPTGWTVDFYGILDGESATVDSNGNFSLWVEIGSGSGPAFARTEDPDGNKSNVASTQVN